MRAIGGGHAIAVLVAIARLSTAPAYADAPQDQEARKIAERHFHAGERAYNAQNFGAAAANFEEAYRVLPLPEIAFSAAQAYRRQYRVEPRLEHARRSVELYRVYLDQVKTGGRVGIAADSIGEMQREVDKLVAAGAQATRGADIERTRLGVSPLLAAEKRGGGMREIADLPDGDDVKMTTSIDGKPVPPFQMMDVEPGPHAVRVEAEGYQTYEATERVVPGASMVAEAVLQPKPARVTIETERGARVRIDGRLAGTAPLATFDLPAGKHLVTVVRRGRVAVARDIEVARGQEVALDAPLEQTARRHAVPFVATGAIIFAGFSLSGLVFAVVEENRAEEQLRAIQAGDQRPAAADRYGQLITRRNEVLTGAIITGGISLAIGGVAAALYWTDHPSDENVRVTPAISASGAGVSVVGRF
jgi:PEGA domain-containing protein